MFRQGNVLLVLFLTFCSIGAIGQTDGNISLDNAVKKGDPSPLTNEAILALSYQNGGLGFGILYKKEVKQNRLFRIGLANIGFSHYTESFSSSSTYKYLNTGFVGNLIIGYEFRFKLHPRVFTYTGIDFMAGIDYAERILDFNSQSADDQTTSSAILQLGLVFNSGVQVKVHDLIMVGINISPNIYYARRHLKDPDEDDPIIDNAVQTSFNSSTVQATVVFTWPRKGQ